jgi:RND family efflux transporter MFP subunit
MFATRLGIRSDGGKMPSGGSKKLIMTVLAIGLTAGLLWLVYGRLQQQPSAGRRSGPSGPVPVDVAPIERGAIELHRTFSGTLEAAAQFVVAPKVSGRVERLFVDLADTVTQGQVVAELDNAEYIQAVAQARADLAVARANLANAVSELETAGREFKRTQSLRGRGIASDSEFDAARADQQAKQAQRQVARAELEKATAALETANIRLGYTQVTAGWSGSDERRIVAERYLDEGQTVAANAPLMRIVDLDPIKGVFYVTEKDYAKLALAQPVVLTTDAYPDERFSGKIDRIAPVFRQNTRQARVEVTVSNSLQRLKPGMFMRAEVVMGRAESATIVPEQALTTRDDRTGVFVVDPKGTSVSWRPVKIFIRDADRVQVEGEGLSGRVVTIGQQFLDDGSAVTIPEQERKEAAAK